jgi:hypothetical protein
VTRARRATRVTASSSVLRSTGLSRSDRWNTVALPPDSLDTSRQEHQSRARSGRVARERNTSPSRPSGACEDRPRSRPRPRPAARQRPSHLPPR